MLSKSLLRTQAIPVVASLFVAACGSSTVDPEAYLIPDEPGLYAVRDGELKRLNGNREWETETWSWRSRLSSDAEFVASHPSLAQTNGGGVGLYKVGWVRSDISADGEIQPIVKGSRWAVAKTQEFEVPLMLDRVAGRADVIHAVPRQPLEDGLYSLQLRAGATSKNARIGINWPQLDHDRYAAKQCVDRYREAQGPQLRACDQQHQLLLGKNLRVHLVKPTREIVDGTQTLVIRGVLANSGQQPRQTPPLTAELKDGSGQVLKRWQFAPDVATIRPGDSVPFETRVEAPPSGTKTVNVRFGSTLTSSM